MRECVWMEGRRCGRTLLEGPDYVIWTRASGWCCVAPSRPGKMLLGVRQHLCVSVLAHVFVRVCVTALRENKAWTKKQYHSMCSLNTREGERGERKECRKDGKGKWGTDGCLLRCWELVVLSYRCWFIIKCSKNWYQTKNVWDDFMKCEIMSESVFQGFTCENGEVWAFRM